MGKKKNGQILVGYDLCDAYAQISYYLPDGEDVETLAVVAGTEQYNIPAALCKRNDVNQWLMGQDALQSVRNGEGFLTNGLVTAAWKGEMVQVGEESFDPVALLTLFIRRSLSYLGTVVSPEHINGIMFTVERLDERMVEVLSQVAANLRLKNARIYFQSHTDSFYEYMLNQPKELWGYDVLLCDYDNKRLKTYLFSCNRNTTPKVVFIDEEEHEGMERAVGEEETELPTEGLDEAFLKLMQEKCEGMNISSVYLIGDGFKDEWADESLRYLCRGRRGFQGNNLYSRGACYAISRKQQPQEEDGEYVFLGEDKLTANIGMHLLRRGEESYFAIMDAGLNWYEAKREFDLILEDGEAITILLTPLKGGEPEEIRMILKGLPEREAWTTRLHVDAQMISRRILCMKVTDMGFGEFTSASGAEWVQQIEVI